MNIKTQELQASIIIDLMGSGLSFEESLEKSFDKVNEFLNNMIGNEFFNTLAFDKIKQIVNGSD